MKKRFAYTLYVIIILCIGFALGLTGQRLFNDAAVNTFAFAVCLTIYSLMAFWFLYMFTFYMRNTFNLQHLPTHKDLSP